MSLYADLLRIVVKLDVPEEVKTRLMELFKEVEDKLNDLNARITALGG